MWSCVRRSSRLKPTSGSSSTHRTLYEASAPIRGRRLDCRKGTRTRREANDACFDVDALLCAFDDLAPAHTDGTKHGAHALSQLAAHIPRTNVLFPVPEPWPLRISCLPWTNGMAPNSDRGRRSHNHLRTPIKADSRQFFIFIPRFSAFVNTQSSL